jgi:hypothetical protein
MATGFYCNCFETIKNHTLIDTTKSGEAQTVEPTLSREAEETRASFRERVGHPLFGEGHEKRELWQSLPRR